MPRVRPPQGWARRRRSRWACGGRGVRGERARGSAQTRYTFRWPTAWADGGCSSAGRAPGCGPGCRGFEPRHSPQGMPPEVQGALSCAGAVGPATRDPRPERPPHASAPRAHPMRPPHAPTPCVRTNFRAVRPRRCGHTGRRVRFLVRTLKERVVWDSIGPCGTCAASCGTHMARTPGQPTPARSAPRAQPVAFTPCRTSDCRHLHSMWRSPKASAGPTSAAAKSSSCNRSPFAFCPMEALPPRHTAGQSREGAVHTSRSLCAGAMPSTR